MADESSVVEDTEIFEITDFTNASPWESFVSEIENILVQWGLTSTDTEESVDFNESYYEQHQKSEKLTYAKHTFIISLHVSGEKKRPSPKQSDQDWPRQLVTMMDPSNDFPPVAHLITRWFGVDQFVLIAPDESSEALSSEAQSKLMLSSISIAIYNIRCATPIFIQVQKHWRHFYIGICQGNDIRTNFDTVHLKKTPPQFNHLAGMIDIFKSKIGKGGSVRRSPVEIAARITYYLRHWRNWPGVEPLGDAKSGLSLESFLTLPIGATIDPIQELHLSAIWSGLNEDTIIDNNTTSGFNPMNAPLWTVKTHLVDNPGLILHELIQEFMKICHKEDSIEHLLGNKILREDMRSPGVGSSDFSHALTRLTGPSSTITSFSSVMYSSSSRLEFGSEFEPISDEDIDMVLQYIFPDCVQDTVGKSHVQDEPLPENKIAKLIKSAHPDSFTARLAKVLCIVNKEYGIKAFAHVWYEIVLELRYRWENGIMLTRLGNDTAPDMMSCLLNQKFQMLNCCIQHKLSHAQRRGRSVSSSSRTSKSSAEPEFLSPSSSLSFSQRKLSNRNSPEDQGTSEDDEDEFFEANETPPTETSLERSIKELSLTERSARSPVVKAKLVDLKPADVDPLSLLSSDLNTTATSNISEVSPADRMGALKPYKDLVLLKTGEPLYVPETQDPAPLTEDMLWEQQQVLSKLGTNEEATHVRAKMQSLSLISDMQSFKAANPGCVLEDFVRWYSPRDWIEGEEDNKEEGESVKETTPSPERGIERAMSHPTDGWDGNDDWGDDWDTEPGDPAVNTGTQFASGRLSLRMRQPGNMWVDSWENATPIPVFRQRRLFDDTKEAEKVLHYLSGVKLSELALMLLPLILHSAIIAVEEKLKSLPLSGCDSFVNDCINLLKTIQKPSLETLPIYQECLSLLQQAEHQLTIADSLLIKLQQGLELGSSDDSKISSKELTTSVQILAQDKQELVLREPTTSLTGIALKGLLMAQEVAQQTKGSQHQPIGFKASAREFILRTVEPYPRPCSSSCPHRMFCLLSKDEMRLSGAFSEDVLFS